MATPLDILNEELRRTADLLEQEQRLQLQQRLFATPQVAAERTSQVRAESGIDVLRVQNNQERLVAQRQYAQSRRGQTELRSQFSAQQETSTDQVRLRTAQVQAQAVHLATPLGRQEVRENQAAKKEQGAAEEQLARRQNIAEYGAVGGGLKNLGMSFAKLNPYVAAASTAFSMASNAFNQAYRLASVASPNTAATYQGSMDVLEAKIGSYFIPMVESVSALIQKVSAAIPDKNSSTGRAISNAGSYVFKAALNTILPGTGELYERVSMGAGKPDARSMKGLPTPSIGSFDEYRTRTQMASLETQGNSLEAQQLAIVVQNTADLIPLLKTVAENTAEGRRGAFR